MTNFKVGDRVRIRPLEEADGSLKDRCGNRIGINDEMIKLSGATDTIGSIHQTGGTIGLQSAGWTWHPDWLELVDAKPLELLHLTSSEDRAAAHQLLWAWRAENPGRYNADWPGWRFFAKVRNGCFACEEAVERAAEYDEDFCSHCPLDLRPSCPLEDSLFHRFRSGRNPGLAREILQRSWSPRPEAPVAPPRWPSPPQVGEIVRVRSWESMEKEFGSEGERIKLPDNAFLGDMRSLCGRLAVVKDSPSPTDLRLRPLDPSDTDDWAWSFSHEMIEPLEPRTVVEPLESEKEGCHQ